MSNEIETIDDLFPEYLDEEDDNLIPTNFLTNEEWVMLFGIPDNE